MDRQSGPPCSCRTGFIRRTGEAIVRTVSGNPPDLSIVRERILDRVSGITSVGLVPVEPRYASTLSEPRFSAAVLAMLALTGLLLAASGLFAIASLDARVREHELGVRLSHGATRRDLQRRLMYQACRPAVVGMIVGIAGAWSAAILLQRFLYQIDPRDPTTYAIVTGLVIVTALSAAWVPAWRAARLDPAAVLRTQ